MPIALAILAAMDVLPRDEVAGYAALGELSLDGSLSPVAGVLPAAMAASGRDLGLICPVAQGGEAAWAGRIEVLAAPDLLSLVNHFRGTQVLSPPEPSGVQAAVTGPDLADVRGLESARRALEVAAAGGHNLLMVGPPGSGKSMLAACMPGILPDLTPAQALEVSMVHSVAGMLDGGRLLMRPPFRSPHSGEPGTGWFNEPSIVRLPLDPVPHPRRPPGVRLPMRPASGLSAGADARGPTGFAKAAPQADARQPSSGHFTDVLEMLERLRAAGEIASYEPVAPGSGRVAWRGDVAAWPLPAVSVIKSGEDERTRNWWVRDFAGPGSSTPMVGRAAMVVRVVRAGRVAYMLEVEPRTYAGGRAGSKGLVFVPADKVRLAAVIGRLLQAASEQGGVWPSHGLLASMTAVDGSASIAATSMWRHRYAAAPAGGPALGSASVIRALSVVLD